MTTFPEPPDDEYAIVYLENSDKPLPEKINQSTRYAYFKTIARGGKAVIQSCKDLHLSRIVCYKTLKKEIASDHFEQQRFLREARVSAMLQHPCTVPIYELGRDNQGHLYFTMKLVHGYTLREILDYRERYDLKQLINVLIPIANCLEYAHSHRVIHRDIKPENILVGPYDEVLLLDWGLAKVWDPDGNHDEEEAPDTSISTAKVSTITDMEKLQGTIAYMSPEQIARDPEIDYRTDIYSFGVVLYEVLCGQPPFQEETVDKMTHEIQQTIPPRPSEISKTYVPELLDNLAMRCIHKDKHLRIPDCGELVRILNEDWPLHPVA